MSVLFMQIRWADFATYGASGSGIDARKSNNKRSSSFAQMPVHNGNFFDGKMRFGTTQLHFSSIQEMTQEAKGGELALGSS
jgi:hypothetical protein